VDIKQVGGFLGEAFSLSHTIRLEFINSVVLQNTGVVSALARVFHMLQLPDDLQKINRLVHGVARIWWRQHERMVKDLTAQPSPIKPVDANGNPITPMEEFTGLELKQYLSSSDVLHQLMFSTILLHWFVHKDGTGGQKRELDFSVWKQLNQGMEAGSTDVPDHVQQRVHAIISRSFIIELAVATANSRNRGDGGGGPDEGGGHGPGDDWGAMVASERPRSPILSPSAALEGWTQIVGGGFPKPSGLSGVQTVTYKHVSNIFSEVTNSLGMLKSPLGFPQNAEGQHAASQGSNGPTQLKATGGQESGPGPRRDDCAWLSICYTLLFFSASPITGAPYAFVELQKVTVSNVQADTRILSLVGVAEPEDHDADLAAAGGNHTKTTTPTGVDKASTPVVIVLLLPDGRWQELNLPKLDLRVQSTAELEMWAAHLTAASQGKVMKPSTTKSSPRNAPQTVTPALPT